MWRMHRALLQTTRSYFICDQYKCFCWWIKSLLQFRFITISCMDITVPHPLPAYTQKKRKLVALPYLKYYLDCDRSGIKRYYSLATNKQMKQKCLIKFKNGCISRQMTSVHLFKSNCSKSKWIRYAKKISVTFVLSFLN